MHNLGAWQFRGGFCQIISITLLNAELFFLDFFFKWWLDSVVDALNHTGVTAPLLYKKGYTTLLMAASHTREFPYPYGSHPLIDNSIRFAGISVRHDQEQYDRCQKIELITSASYHFGQPIPHVRVCWKTKDGTNCLSCEKCLRTLNNILVTGNNPVNYGLIIEAADVMKRTKEFLERDPLQDNKLFWEWNVIKKRAASYTAPDQKLNDYFMWLASVKLDNQHYETIHTEDIRKDYFTWLWTTSSKKS